MKNPLNHGPYVSPFDHQPDTDIARLMRKWLLAEYSEHLTDSTLADLRYFDALVSGQTTLRAVDFHHLQTVLYPHFSKYALSRLTLWAGFGLGGTR